MKKLAVGIGIVALVLVSKGFGADTIPIQKTTSSGAGTSLINPASKNVGAAPAVDGDPGETGEPQPYVASVEAYGSGRINEVVLKETLGKELDLWLKMGLAGDPKSPELEAKLADKVKKKFGFADAEWSIVEYFESGDPAIHITLDVVEKEDVAKRMNFIPAPTGEFKDPDNLIKQWNEYEDLALELVETGQLEPEADECVAFHCPFSHVHPQLKKYEKIFVEGVKKHWQALVDIQMKDKRPEWRAAATYLLPYAKDGKKVVTQMVDRIHDPDPAVRNNALRVLGDIAEFHTELIIPIRPVLDALIFPRASDRSKAIYVAYLLALNSQQARDEIAKSSLNDLVQMLGSKQPDHHELAHGILRKISGKEYAANDTTSWRNWTAKIQKDRMLTRK